MTRLQNVACNGAVGLNMDHLPLNDIPMLVLSVNFLFRDEIFENRDQICWCYGVERNDMDRILASGGYFYDEPNHHVL